MHFDEGPGSGNADGEATKSVKFDQLASRISASIYAYEADANLIAGHGVQLSPEKPRLLMKIPVIKEDALPDVIKFTQSDARR